MKLPSSIQVIITPDRESNSEMPILNTSSSASLDCDIVSSSCCSAFSASDDDDVHLSSSTAPGSRDQVTQPRSFITEIQDDELEQDRTNQPKKRGPKKKRMTPARIAKLKQRRLKVSKQTIQLVT